MGEQCTVKEECLKVIQDTFPSKLKCSGRVARAIIDHECKSFPFWAIAATTEAVRQRHKYVVGGCSYIVPHNSGMELWALREGRRQTPFRNDVVESCAGELL
jgi:hypothetical protein